MFIYVWVMLLSVLWAYALVQIRQLPAEKVRLGRAEVSRKTLTWGALVLSMLPPALLSGFRYAIGVDYFYTYVPLYQKIAAGASLKEAGTEAGYYWLNRLIILAGGGTVWLFLITALLTVGLFYLAFYEQSEMFVLSVALFFAAESYFISLMYVRQFLAAALIVYSFRFIREKSFWKYALCVLAAFLFHQSAILFLPLYVLCLVPIHPLVLTGLVAALSALHGPLLRLLRWGLGFTKYAAYWDSVFLQHYRIYTYGLFKYAILFFVACFFYKKNRTDRFYVFSLNCLAVLVYLACNFDVMPQTDRISWYLELVVLFLIPLLVKRCSIPWLKPVLLVGLLSVFGVITVDDVYVNGAHGVVPYRFVFSPDAVIW